jgi:hypothetical protein
VNSISRLQLTRSHLPLSQESLFWITLTLHHFVFNNFYDGETNPNEGFAVAESERTHPCPTIVPVRPRRFRFTALASG